MSAKALTFSSCHLGITICKNIFIIPWDYSLVRKLKDRKELLKAAGDVRVKDIQPILGKIAITVPVDLCCYLRTNSAFVSEKPLLLPIVFKSMLCRLTFAPPFSNFGSIFFSTKENLLRNL